MTSRAQVTVTLQRNVGRKWLSDSEREQIETFGVADWPTLNDHDWTAMRGYTRDALARSVGPVSEQYDSGRWSLGNERVILTVLDAKVDEASRLALLRGELTKIAFNFRQDEIRYSVGTLNRVEVDPPE
jgi:hypothetical protein